MQLSALSRERATHDLDPLRIGADGTTAPGFQTVSDILCDFPEPGTIQLDRAMGNLVRLVSGIGETVTIQEEDDYPLLFAASPDRVGAVLEDLDAHGYIVIRKRSARGDGLSMVSITANGFDRARERPSPAKTTQAFVGMSFDSLLDKAYEEGIALAVADAGFESLRIDRKPSNQKICEEILEAIKASKFMIADVTGQRSAVYFEAGFAMGQGLPVIWCCRSDDMKNVSFNTRQYSHVVWNEPDDLRQKLYERIKVTIR